MTSNDFEWLRMTLNGFERLQATSNGESSSGESFSLLLETLTLDPLSLLVESLLTFNRSENRVRHFDSIERSLWFAFIAISSCRKIHFRFFELKRLGHYGANTIDDHYWWPLLVITFWCVHYWRAYCWRPGDWSPILLEYKLLESTLFPSMLLPHYSQHALCPPSGQRAWRSLGS